MRSKSHFQERIVQCVFVVLAALAPFARAQQADSPAAKTQKNAENPPLRPTAKPSATASPEQLQINPQELERLTKAADKVLNRIQSEENDLYLRLNYFEKPDRLNPNSYASKEEIAQWRGILQQFKEKHDLVTKLYADVGKDLDSELRNAGGNEELVARFKKIIIDGFPWSTIEKKKNLIADFIDEHARLLAFYEKNWGAWTGTSDSNKAEFTSASAANIYKRLRLQILNTSQEIEKEYKEMSE
ncbi:MAG: hypothetical protein JO334_15660 [Verrucomicrobia bacterium]|nr:hypothetical protein [Verrucomicrobiota bacterium]